MEFWRLKHCGCTNAYLEVVTIDLSVCNAWVYFWCYLVAIWIGCVYLCIFGCIQGHFSCITCFEIVKCNCAHLIMVRLWEFNKTWFEFFWLQFCTFEGIKSIWGEEGLIWMILYKMGVGRHILEPKNLFCVD